MTNTAQYKPAPPERVMGFMVGLCISTKNQTMATFALMELVAYVAFHANNRTPTDLS